jgi:hypothetical protein
VCPLTVRVPLQYPRSSVRTSVGALPHVLVEDAVLVVVAAEDVDGAGGVDHGSLGHARAPRGAGSNTRPRLTCGNQTDDQPMTNATGARGRSARCIAALLIPQVLAAPWQGPHPRTHKPTRTPDRTHAHMHMHAHAHARSPTGSPFLSIWLSIYLSENQRVSMSTSIYIYPARSIYI